MSLAGESWIGPNGYTGVRFEAANEAGVDYDQVSEDLIEWVYPDLVTHYMNTEWIAERAILAPTNVVASQINTMCNDMLPGIARTWLLFVLRGRYGAGVNTAAEVSTAYVALRGRRGSG